MKEFSKLDTRHYCLASGILILSFYLPQPLILMDKTKVYKQNIFCLKKCLKIYIFKQSIACLLFPVVHNCHSNNKNKTVNKEVVINKKFHSHIKTVFFQS